MHADDSARSWLEQHSTSTPRVIAYDVHRCCGGGKICQIKVRDLSARDQTDRFAAGTLNDGTVFLIDAMAAKRLPARFGLTMRGIGPFRHLDLDLEPEQWGTLLYT